MNPAPDLESQKVAIVTGAERGIGAALVTAFRGAGYAVVTTSRSIPASDDSHPLTVQGDITEVHTAVRVVEHALDRSGGSTASSTTRGSTSKSHSRNTRLRTTPRSPR